MSATSKTSVKVGMITPDPRVTKELPKDVRGIERWIKAMGGRKVDSRERARLRKRGLLGMPKEWAGYWRDHIEG
jgi:hypothetical protein